MNNVAKIEDAIEEKMNEIETYSGIKRPNSYFLLGHLLVEYADRCVGRGNAHFRKEK